jgi:ABC-type glycerol-3-phosphate transport system permease component
VGVGSAAPAGARLHRGGGSVGLADSLWALIFPAFGVFFMRQAFLQVPQELVDAATIDGIARTGVKG